HAMCPVRHDDMREDLSMLGLVPRPTPGSGGTSSSALIQGPVKSVRFSSPLAPEYRGEGSRIPGSINRAVNQLWLMAFRRNSSCYLWKRVATVVPLSIWNR